MKILNTQEYPHIPQSDLVKIYRHLPRLSESGPWIAGGSVWRTINNEPLNNCDIDVFFNNKGHYEEGCRQMNAYPYVNNILNEKKNKWNTTYKVHINEGKYDKTIDVQFIGMFFNKKIENLLNSFDFAVCQFGFDGRNFFCGEKSLEDLKKRELSIQRITHPKPFFRHLLKYLNNGFTISSDETRKITQVILDINVWSKSKKESELYGDDDREVDVAAPATLRNEFIGNWVNNTQTIATAHPTRDMWGEWPDTVPATPANTNADIIRTFGDTEYTYANATPIAPLPTYDNATVHYTINTQGVVDTPAIPIDLVYNEPIRENRPIEQTAATRQETLYEITQRERLRRRRRPVEEINPETHTILTPETRRVIDEALNEMTNNDVTRQTVNNELNRNTPRDAGAEIPW